MAISESPWHTGSLKAAVWSILLITVPLEFRAVVHTVGARYNKLHCPLSTCLQPPSMETVTTASRQYVPRVPRRVPFSRLSPSPVCRSLHILSPSRSLFPSLYTLESKAQSPHCLPFLFLLSYSLAKLQPRGSRRPEALGQAPKGLQSAPSALLHRFTPLLPSKYPSYLLSPQCGPALASGFPEESGIDGRSPVNRRLSCLSKEKPV